MKTKRLYSLFKRARAKKGGKWERISPLAFPKETAIRLYQNRLLSSAMGGDPDYELRLRPVTQQLTLEM